MADQKPNAVPFAHGAAGHQGLTSNSSGTILTKPCTQAEISFYESASTSPAHAAFYAHMPTFLGSLRPATDQPGLSKLLHGSGGVGAPSVPDTSDGKVEEATSAQQNENEKDKNDKAEKAEKGEGWTPSGGKKLATGLAICLANTASGCVRPCVLDLKLGARLWDDEAPVAKRQKLDEVANSTTSGSLGFRVAGMRVWVGGGEGKLAEEEEEFVKLEDGYKSYDKFYGRQFKGRQDVRKAFEAFLPPAKGAGSGSGGGYREEIARRFVRELESVVYMLEHEESRMYSASLLFVYEGDEAQMGRALEFEKEREEGGDDHDDDGVEMGDGGLGKDENDEEIEPKVHDLRLIDFAHARWAPGEGEDENALRGVRSALEVLRDVLGE